jgi:hypothetical protein
MIRKVGEVAGGGHDLSMQCLDVTDSEILFVVFAVLLGQAVCLECIDDS